MSLLGNLPAADAAVAPSHSEDPPDESLFARLGRYVGQNKFANLKMFTGQAGEALLHPKIFPRASLLHNTELSPEHAQEVADGNRGSLSRQKRRRALLATLAPRDPMATMWDSR